VPASSRCTVRSALRHRMAEQHLGAVRVVADEHAVDELPHQHETQTGRAGTTWGGQRLSPAPPVANLQAESVGLGP
jgi:hypothetical protein